MQLGTPTSQDDGGSRVPLYPLYRVSHRFLTFCVYGRFIYRVRTNTFNVLMFHTPTSPSSGWLRNHTECLLVGVAKLIWPQCLTHPPSHHLIIPRCRKINFYKDIKFYTLNLPQDVMLQ